MNLRICVALILLDIQPIGSRQQLPIKMTKIIAGHVRPMLGEVGGEPEIRRAMQPGDETFDYGASDQLERAYARKNLWRQESSADLLCVVLNHVEHSNRDGQDEQ